MSVRFSRGLSERPVGEDDVLYFLNRELSPLLRELLRRLAGEPSPFAWSAGSASVDISGATDFAASATLTQDSTLTLTNGYDGAEGSIWVKQDATGGWGITFSAAGSTLLLEDPFVDADPNPAPDSVTFYRYAFAEVAGESFLYIERHMLL